MPKSHRVPKRAPRILHAVAALAAISAIAPAMAGADNTTYLNAGSLSPGVSGRDGDLTRTHLESSRGWADISTHTIEAGAHEPGGLTLYLSWASALNYACHNYSLENKGAMVENGNTVTQNPVTAISGWQGSGADFYC